ncbi:MAG TPA: hypothetical protein VHN37_00910 [Actinomycetota bacterium]|nr:hypothetical protein [Actinomycetota bacterium]
MGKRLPLAVFVAALATAVLAGSVAARPADSRVQTLEYVGGGVTVTPGQTVKLRAGDGLGAVVFRGGPERLVSFEIRDAHEQPVTGIVVQPGDEDGRHFCGKTDKAMKVRPYENVTVYLVNGPCGRTGASVVTTGTVTATFVRK